MDCECKQCIHGVCQQERPFAPDGQPCASGRCVQGQCVNSNRPFAYDEEVGTLIGNPGIEPVWTDRQRNKLQAKKTEFEFLQGWKKYTYFFCKLRKLKKH